MASDSRQTRFMLLFEPRRDALWRFVRAMVRSTHEAEDVMGETILRAFEGFDSVRDEQAFTSFLFTIARRLYKRQRWRRTFFGEYDEESAHSIPHTDMQPDVLMDVVLLRQALQTLPEKQRESIVLFDILGLSLEEVREIQGGTLSGVKSRLVRARQALARQLDCLQDKNDYGTAQSPTQLVLRGGTPRGVTGNVR